MRADRPMSGERGPESLIKVVHLGGDRPDVAAPELAGSLQDAFGVIAHPGRHCLPRQPERLINTRHVPVI